MKYQVPPDRTVYTFHRDLLDQKHLMIAGASGSGKSVLLNGMIYNALLRPPVDCMNGVQFIFIDPKRVELCQYKALPHVLRYASEPGEMLSALQYAINLTERRFCTMQRAGLRLYGGSDVYVMIDEFADLMATQAKQIKPLIQRLAQIGRAARIHIVLCTQCPLAKVIPTEIKVNFDSIIGLHTANAQQSRNVIGQTGCECLPAYGSAYYIKPGHDLQRYNGIPLFTDEQIQERIDWWTAQKTGKIGIFRRLLRGA